jgi:hypothetical protein
MKKSKTDTVAVSGVLGENDKKISDIEKSIKAALDRKRKIIMESKLYIYGQLSELFCGMEGQELLDAVTKEHTLIGKLTASGMTYDQIAELADDSSADAENDAEDDDADSVHDNNVSEFQTSFFDENHSD